MKQEPKKVLIKGLSAKEIRLSESGFEPLTNGFSIQYSTAELLRQWINVVKHSEIKSNR